MMEEIPMSNASDFIIENGVLKKYVGPGGDVVIPDGVIEIGKEAFAQCAGLTGIMMPNTVTVIGISAFFWCRNLTSVQIGNHVQKIDMFAFSDCDQLREIIIPESIKVIEAQAFYGCLLCKTTIMGADVQIHATAFKDLGNWKLICAPNLSLEQIPKANRFNAAIGYLQMWAEKMAVPKPIEEEYATYIKRIKKKLIDEHIMQYAKVHALQYVAEQKLIKKTEIDPLLERAQRVNSTELTAVLMNYLNAEFGTGFEKAVERETAIEEKNKKAVAKKKQTEARKDPKSGVKKLWTVKILPDGTCRLGGYKGIMEELYVPDEVDGHPVTELGNRDDPMANADGYKVLRRVVLPKTLRAIGRNAFAGTQIEEIDIPEGVQKIEKRLFAMCLQLRSIKLPSSVEQIALDAFDSCIHLETINIPAKVKRIPKDMFNSPWYGIKYPSACIGLKHIYIEGENTQIEADAFRTYDVPEMLTIHAPAGSYAEAYAKENNIPFVAE